jgi:hypothetical protein
VWEQLKASLPELADADLHPGTPWALDPAIQPGNVRLTNAEPLLVNRIDSWRLRPWARTRIPNLFLASDYVRTYTNLATMEAANEAARRAVNAILDASGSRAEPCRLWELHEPFWVKPWRGWDLLRYRRGEPWAAEFPEFVQAMARTALSMAPAIGGPDEYADASARDVAARGIGVVPDPVQQEVVDLVLDAASALERGDVAKLGTFFTDRAKIELDGQPVGSAPWLDGLKSFVSRGGQVVVDVRSLQELRPSRRSVVARFAADVRVPGERRVKTAGPGRLEVSLVPGGEREAGAPGWRIHALRYTAAS